MAIHHSIPFNDLNFEWDFGDGSQSESGAGFFGPNHIYVQDGPYTATVTATDHLGLWDDGELEFDVVNVAPVVTVSPGATIDFAEAFDFSATFSDPGVLDAPWNWAIDWGNGDGLAGSTDDRGAAFGGAITYYEVGTFDVEACVTDKDGGNGCASVEVTVTATYDGLCSLVRTYVTHRGVANALCVKIAAAERAAARDNGRARDGSLGALIRQVNAQNGKKVPADKAWILVAYADAIMS